MQDDMKNNLQSLLFLIVLLFSLGLFTNAIAQDITFVPRGTVLDDTIGSEIIFYIDVTNISQTSQTLFMVRTINNLPGEWQSSLCFESCFPGWLDSIATTTDFQSSPLAPGETREVSIHVFPLANSGTGHIQMQAATFNNPNNRIVVDLTAIVNPVSVDDKADLPDEYYLKQNYPNPFNPSTKINFGIKYAGLVEITIYNILGNKIATIFNGYKTAGNHSVKFENSNLSSGVYFYKIVAGDFVQIKKMILEK
jgi:hypothetical protein